MIASGGGNDESSSSPVSVRRDFALSSLKRARDQGGMTLLVDGVAGMGKTYLLREIMDAATAEGDWLVTFARADEIESGEPYSFIERFVASSRIPDWHFVPDVHTGPVQVARDCIRHLTADSSSPARVMVIDDAQWIDAESQRVMRYLIPRVTRRNIFLAFGVRAPHQSESFGEFLSGLVRDSPLEAHFRVAPLTIHEIAALALERRGVGISAATAQRMFDVTGGSFLGIDSMLAALTADEITQLRFSWSVPIRSNLIDHDLLLHQFHQLSPRAQRTSEIVCLAGHELTPTGIEAAAAALGEPVELEEAIRAEVLSESGFGSTILPRHALLSQAVTAVTTEDRSRAVFQALALTTDGYRSLRHTLRGARQWDDQLAQRVNNFVREAVSKNNLSIASEVLRSALRVAATPADRMGLIESLALVHLQGKSGYQVLDLLGEIEDFSPSILHEFVELVISAHQVGRHFPMERVQRLLAAPANTPDDRAVVAFFSFMVVILTMRSNDLTMVPSLIALAKNRVEQAPSNSDELSDQRLGWMIEKDGHLLVLDCYLMVHDQMMGRMGDVAHAVPGLTRRIDALADGPLKVDAIVAVAGAKLSLGDMVEGRSLAEQGVELLERVSEPWAAATARLILVDCLVLQGEFTEATELIVITEEVALVALDVETRFTLASLRVFIAAVTGKRTSSLEVDRAAGRHEVPWEGFAPDLALLADCEIARVRGNFPEILRASAGPRADRLKNTRRGFLTYRAYALIETDQLGDAAELIDQLAEWRGAGWQEYWGTLDWLQARFAQKRGDSQASRWHYQAAIENRTFPLPLGLTMADFGEFLISQGDIAAGARMLRSAIAVLEDIGAEGYLPKVREAVRDAQPKEADGDIGQRITQMLTERERQIVEHLAKGRSNSQIAESLVVSVTTVRSHVSNVLRKLQLSSRGEIVKLLRDDSTSDG